MSKKTDRHGPSWTEVVLGAFLSLLLGVALGAVLLILRPAVVAKEEPKERAPNTVYFVEGSRDAAKAKQGAAKRQAFAAGGSVTLTEDELNGLIAPGTPPPAAAKGAEKAKAAEQPKDAPAPAAGGFLSPGTPNVRIREGVLQVGVPLTVDLLDQKIIAQARGTFVKQGDAFVFEPTETYLGSCPLNRLPFLAGYVRGKLLAAQPIPDDLKAAWGKLANVSVEGNALKLTMP